MFPGKIFSKERSLLLFWRKLPDSYASCNGENLAYVRCKTHQSRHVLGNNRPGGTVGTGEQWAQGRPGGTAGTEEQWAQRNSRHRGTVGTKEWIDPTKTEGHILESWERHSIICLFSSLRFEHILALIVLLIILCENVFWVRWISWRYFRLKLETLEKMDAWKFERKPFGMTLRWRHPTQRNDLTDICWKYHVCQVLWKPTQIPLLREEPISRLLIIDCVGPLPNKGW